MINLAGKYANSLFKNPAASAVAGGLGAAGLATLGNITSGEANQEASGRMGLEALGAGALGAVVGSQIPGLRGMATTGLRNLGNVVLKGPGAAARKARMSEGDIRNAEFARDMLREAYGQGADPEQLRQQLKSSLRGSQALINTAGIPLGLTAAGALGGMVGGGIANAGGMVGIPGLQQVAMNPEEPGSSNTTGARNMRPTMQYI